VRAFWSNARTRTVNGQTPCWPGTGHRRTLRAAEIEVFLRDGFRLKGIVYWTLIELLGKPALDGLFLFKNLRLQIEFDLGWPSGGMDQW
jgi:hypothetical protein